MCFRTSGAFPALSGCNLLGLILRNTGSLLWVHDRLLSSGDAGSAILVAQRIRHDNTVGLHIQKGMMTKGPREAGRPLVIGIGASAGE